MPFQIDVFCILHFEPDSGIPFAGDPDHRRRKVDARLFFSPQARECIAGCAAHFQHPVVLVYEVIAIPDYVVPEITVALAVAVQAGCYFLEVFVKSPFAGVKPAAFFQFRPFG